MVVVVVHGRQVHAAKRTVQAATDGLAQRQSLLRVQVELKARNGVCIKRRRRLMMMMMMGVPVDTDDTEQHADAKDADRVLEACCSRQPS